MTDNPLQYILITNPNILTIFYFYKDTPNPNIQPNNDDLFNNPPYQCPICFIDIEDFIPNPNYRQFYIVNNKLCKCFKNVIICQNCLFHYLLINKCFICNKYIYSCFTKIHDVINFQDIQIYNKFSNYRIKKIKNYIESRQYIREPPRDSSAITNLSPSSTLTPASIYISPPNNESFPYNICCCEKIAHFFVLCPITVIFGLLFLSFYQISTQDY